MHWKNLLREQIEAAYNATEGLLGLVDEDMLTWKPQGGSNWMTTGQLLMHITNACGAPMKGFVTGDWGFPEGLDPRQIPPEEMLPPAEKLPAISSVSEARKLLAADKQTALEMIDSTREDDLANKTASAPWSPRQKVLGQWMLEMVDHLTSHKSQLFFYLKLQGEPVNTGHLWGM
jgi:uncharacterized damage-inducible protein DinB